MPLAENNVLKVEKINKCVQSSLNTQGEEVGGVGLMPEEQLQL